MQTEKLKGRLIVLDGPDGCGKSTQAKMLSQYLTDRDIQTAMFRDPGTTAIGEQIRTILLDPRNEAMDTRTELMLYMAARTQLWAECIRPALEQNKCVILDRWLSSTCAYQGYAGDFRLDNVIRMGNDCLERPWPDLTIILDIDLETATKRLNRTLDRMEQKSADYHKKVRQGFLKLTEKIQNTTIINAAENIDTVHTNVLNAIENHF